MASISYHKALDKKRNTLISFGIQGGIVQRRINLDGDGTNPDSGLKFGDEIQARFNGMNGFTSTDRGRIMDNKSYFDLNAGILLTTRMNKQTDLNIGASFYHITKPKYGFIDANDNPVGNQDPDSVTVRLPMRFQLHGQFKIFTKFLDFYSLNFF